MFEADVHFHDLGAPPAIAGGALVFGGSHVRPLAHRMVHWYALAGPVRLLVVARERFSDDDAVSGTCRTADEHEIDTVLADLDNYLLDYAAFIFDRDDTAIRYRTSPIVSVPAYIHTNGGLVMVDWDYTRLLRKMTVRPSIDIVLAQIAGRSPYGSRTIVENLYRTVADSVTTVKLSGVAFCYPPPIEHEGPRGVAPNVDLTSVLLETIGDLIAARRLSPAQVAVEVSGGMDSALTAMAAAGALDGRLLSIGAQFSGAMGRAQAERRSLLVDRGGFDDLSVPAERYPPFLPGTARRTGLNVLPDDENYPELFEVMFAALRSAGIDTLVSGFGGDELYAIYEGEGDGSDVSRQAFPSPFLSREGRRRAQAVQSDYPTSWLQPSCWQSAAARSQRLLRFGLWPVYPFINVSLARFVAALPYPHRRDRNLLRSTLTRVLGNSVFETDYQKEAFGAVARRGIEENKAYLLDLVRCSPLIEGHGIDGAVLLRSLEVPAISLDKPTFEGLFRSLKVLAFFA